MTDETGNLFLEYMRRFEKTIAEMRPDLHALRHGLADAARRMTALVDQCMCLNRRRDRMDERIERIERRLDPVEG